MAGSNLSQEIKTHAVFVAFDAHRSDSGTPTSLDVTMSSVFKVRSELLTSIGHLPPAVQRKKHSTTIRRHRDRWVCPRVQDLIVDPPIMSKRSIANYFQEAKHRSLRVMHGDLKYRSCAVIREPLMSDKTQKNTLRSLACFDSF